MAKIGKVNAVFSASTSGLTSGVRQASRSMQNLQGSVASLRSGMTALVAIQGAQFFTQIAGSAIRGVRALTDWGNAEAQVIDRTAKLATQLGFTYGEMAGLGLAAQFAGVDMETVGRAVTRANVAFGNAAAGSRQAIQAFERIGLSVDQLNGLSASDQFDLIAEAIAQLPSQAERAAAAVAIFGRSGADLLPLFQSGAGAIAAAREEAERFGLTLTDAQADNVENMNDAFTRAQSAIQGVIQQVVAYLAPAIDAVTTAFSDLIGSVGGANIGQAIGEALLQGARSLAEFGDYLIANLTPLWQYVSEVGGQWNAVWSIGDRVAQFLYGTAEVFRGVFLGIVSGMTTVAARLVSAAGEIASAIPGWSQTGAELQAAGQSLRESASGFGDSATQAFENSAEAFGNAIFGRTEEAGEAIAGPLVQSIDEAIEAARNAANTVSAAAANEVATVQVEQTVEIQSVKEAIQGIEASSAEGIREMFRIMRGEPGGGVEERQLAALEQIVANTQAGGERFELEVAELAPAAGG